ncbi:hypothetical protein M1506_00140 [Patescibacteria group bacterium]|nr:hypothetical protein [Patescibacteria group bacterium]
MFRKKSVILLIGLSILFLIITAGLVIPKIGSLTYPSIIHFDKWNGVNFLGDGGDFLGMLLIGLAFIVMNVFLSFKLYHKERFVSYLFLSANIIISIIILIFASVVIGNN